MNNNICALKGVVRWKRPKSQVILKDNFKLKKKFLWNKAFATKDSSFIFYINF
jgi:hypothetical protein